jgi:low affinity Fe/Cu permease
MVHFPKKKKYFRTITSAMQRIIEETLRAGHASNPSLGIEIAKEAAKLGLELATLS